MKYQNFMIVTLKLLNIISPKFTTIVLARLFTTPLKHKPPARENQMETHSKKIFIQVPEINKKILVYVYGTGHKKALLVHGWSGRGTQLCKIAEELMKLNYTIISFDAPAHGKSSGSKTSMTEFISSIMEIQGKFGPFEFALGHSLGGMSVLNAINNKLSVNKAVIISSGDIVHEIIEDFINKLNLDSKYAQLLQKYFEEKTNDKMDSYSASVAARKIMIPVLVIHDKNDSDVPVKSAYNIYRNLKNSELFITEGLGHRKILGNEMVLHQIREFINK